MKAKRTTNLEARQLKRQLLCAVIFGAMIPVQAAFGGDPKPNPFIETSVKTAVIHEGLQAVPSRAQPIKVGDVRENRAFTPVRPPTRPRPKRLPAVQSQAKDAAKAQIQHEPSPEPNYTPAAQIASRPQAAPKSSARPIRPAEPVQNVRRQQSVPQPRKIARSISHRTPTTAVGQPVTWLPSTTTAACQRDAMRYLKEAMQEYSRKAYASAEASAWSALRYTAEGIDITDRAATFGTNRGKSPAVNDLDVARTAMREARDFAGKFGKMDAEAMERIVISHSTPVLKGQSLRNVPAADAIDRYLNEARVRLNRLAKFRPEAAQALDLIAAIYLGRGEERLLPSQTALCLRRAALQGQPGNASLASRLGQHLAALGLDTEAEWALQHALSIEPSADTSQTLALVQQRAGDRAAAIRMTAQVRSRLPAGYEQNRGPVPSVVQISPREFATISRPVNNAQPSGMTMPSRKTPPVPVRVSPNETKASVAPVSHASNASSKQTLTDPAYYSAPPKKKSAFRRVVDSVGNLW